MSLSPLPTAAAQPTWGDAGCLTPYPPAEGAAAGAGELRADRWIASALFSPAALRKAAVEATRAAKTARAGFVALNRLLKTQPRLLIACIEHWRASHTSTVGVIRGIFLPSWSPEAAEAAGMEVD